MTGVAWSYISEGLGNVDAICITSAVWDRDREAWILFDISDSKTTVLSTCVCVCVSVCVCVCTCARGFVGGGTVSRAG